MLTLRKPYLLFLGDAQTRATAKTAFGVHDWCPDDVLAEWALSGAKVSTGKPRLGPAEAAAAGAQSLLIGVAPAGGQLPEAWLPTLLDAIHQGMDIVNGLHTRLSEFPQLTAAARAHGVALHDVRHTAWPRVTGTGVKRSGKRLLTVGTDCAVGKKYTALALCKAIRSRGGKASFRATGQTGIMIAGAGVAIDAVVSDFVAGVAEQLSPDNEAGHWDVIEGQGSLFHPAYAGVTLGLLHGSQPDALVLCHDPSRRHIETVATSPIPDLGMAIEAYIAAGRLTNPGIACVGISINSSSMTEANWRVYREALSRRFGVPVVDPMRGGVDAIAQALLASP